MFKLEVLYHDDISLGKMIDKLLNKEPCILKNYKKLQKITNIKIKDYTSPTQVATTISIGKWSFQPKRNYTKLNESVYKILNILVKKYLIKLPPIVQNHFPNAIYEQYRFK